LISDAQTAGRPVGGQSFQQLRYDARSLRADDALDDRHGGRFE
jgi:hypothetical protein